MLLLYALLYIKDTLLWFLKRCTLIAFCYFIWVFLHYHIIPNYQLSNNVIIAVCILFLVGVPCKVVNYTSDTIQCITGPAPPSSTVYPGMLIYQ